MQVLFIVPMPVTVYGFAMRAIYPPIGVLSLSAMLQREGHRPGVMDLWAHHLTDMQLCSRIAELRPDVIGFSCITASINEGVRLAGIVKNRFPSIPIVFGGIHPTIAPQQTIANNSIDFVALGEAEHTIVELVAALSANPQDCENVPGLMLKHNGEIITTAPRQLERDLDSFPFPAFDLLGDLGPYCPPDAARLPALPLMTSRGCPGRCTYCCTKQIFGRVFRARSVENIVREIEQLISRHHAREVHFLDDTITANKNRVLALCKELNRRSFPVRYEVSNGLRADMVDKEILEALKSIGLVNVGFGVESGNEHILEVIKKGIAKDQVRRAVALAKGLGFETWCFFIIGLPQETAETIKDTIDFAIELDPDFAKFLILKPFPGSEVFEELSKEKLIDSFDYTRYGVYTAPVHHLQTLSANDIEAWKRKAYRRFYLRPDKLLSHAWRLKSPTQLFIVLKNTLFILKNMFLANKGR
jgi:anaerobic magnesium-protoporphyrin IX monomethyl ester cyclase